MEKQPENRHSRNILVTGPPRMGKSTLIERIVSKIRRPVTGFFTREIREGGKRVGFSIVMFLIEVTEKNRDELVNLPLFSF